MTSASSRLSPSDLVQIERVVQAAQIAQFATPALLALHHPEAVVVNLVGRRVLGREALGQAMTAALASPLAEVRTELSVVEIRSPAEGVAVVSCTKTVHDDRDAAGPGPSLPRSGALTYVMVRAGDTWKIALAQTTPKA